MGWEVLDKCQHTTFVGMKKLRNRSILYRMNSEDAAVWLQCLDIQKSFMVNFGGTLTNKLYYFMAEFGPTTFNAGSSFTHAKLEEVNLLNENSITFFKYIKPSHLNFTLPHRVLEESSETQYPKVIP
ncbi:hypothetical protein L208DRAFT_1559746 [Tricholoma matsutake]|nr:hypothetical protein L208DRAFT_1559746 [Tricholoma matsutake 945]